jgi:hypothetical protein
MSPSSDNSCSSLIPFEVPTALPFDVTECAINRFFFDYTLPIARPFGLTHAGIFDYVPAVFASAPSSSSLREAISAVSLANFDRRTGFAIEGNRINVERHYGNALRLVKKEMQDPATASSDQLVLAVQMLGIFEVRDTSGLSIIYVISSFRGLCYAIVPSCSKLTF